VYWHWDLDAVEKLLCPVWILSKQASREGFMLTQTGGDSGAMSAMIVNHKGNKTVAVVTLHNSTTRKRLIFSSSKTSGACQLLPTGCDTEKPS
jgi:hypothetical protein